MRHAMLLIAALALAACENTEGGSASGTAPAATQPAAPSAPSTPAATGGPAGSDVAAVLFAATCLGEAPTFAGSPGKFAEAGLTPGENGFFVNADGSLAAKVSARNEPGGRNLVRCEVRYAARDSAPASETMMEILKRLGADPTPRRDELDNRPVDVWPGRIDEKNGFIAHMPQTPDSNFGVVFSSFAQ